MKRFDITEYGAKGNGVTNDHLAITNALANAIKSNGCLYVPAGRWCIDSQLTGLAIANKISIVGDGPNVSVIVARKGTNALSLQFQQTGIQQPNNLNIADIGFEAEGTVGTAIAVNYGNPTTTNDHYRPSVTIRNTIVSSGDSGSWSNGINISDAWNVTMTDVYVSGNAYGGNWNAMSGSGIQFNHMCVNAHLTNVRSNFWACGFLYNAENGGNTEGIFFNNCSMVGVKRGVWIIGNPNAPAPRMSTFTWTGGLIECRVGGVTSGSAAFHLQNVWTGIISSMQMITEVIPLDNTTYGVFIDNCDGILVDNCDINAWSMGVITVGKCRAIKLSGNTYTNVALQTLFTSDTTDSRSYGHVLPYGGQNEIDQSGLNKMGWV